MIQRLKMWQHLIVDYLWQQDYPNARKDKMTPKCIRLGFWFFQHVEIQDWKCGHSGSWIIWGLWSQIIHHQHPYSGLQPPINTQKKTTHTHWQKEMFINAHTIKLLYTKNPEKSDICTKKTLEFLMNNPHSVCSPYPYKCPKCRSPKKRHSVITSVFFVNLFITNKLASLEATLVRNSAHPLNHWLTDRGKV